ncbi:hypothetical protein JYT74_02705 [Crocinitomix catalasitica]|nr:hypothetical protein [Crocinitomix catalasitica]
MLILFWGSYANAQKFDHHLKGQTIRSYAINPNNTKQILLGMKGEAGEGKVYLSENAGKSWNITNNDLALSDSAEDIQAVAFLNDGSFLAGCWKNGLFRSIDSGQSWSAVENFPAKDIRAIKVSTLEDGLLFLATTTVGVLLSKDNLKTWEQTNDKELASWDIELDPTNSKNLYALPFSGGLAKSKDGGKTFKTFHKQSGTMMYDMKITFDGGTWAVGGGDSATFIMRRPFNGSGWKNIVDSLTPPAQFSAVEDVDGIVYFGTWDMGVFTLRDGVWDSLPEVDSKIITKIDYANDHLYFFTRDNGVFRQKKKIDCELTFSWVFDPKKKSGLYWEVKSNCPIESMHTAIFGSRDTLLYDYRETDLRKLSAEVEKSIGNNSAVKPGWHHVIFDITFVNGIKKEFHGSVEKPEIIK